MMLRAYFWLCNQGSLMVGLMGPRVEPGITPELQGKCHGPVYLFDPFEIIVHPVYGLGFPYEGIEINLRIIIMQCAAAT